MVVAIPTHFWAIDRSRFFELENVRKLPQEFADIVDGLVFFEIAVKRIQWSNWLKAGLRLVGELQITKQRGRDHWRPLFTMIPAKFLLDLWDSIAV